MFHKSLAIASVVLLSACDEGGEFAWPTADTADSVNAEGSTSATQVTQGETDVERPDVFEVTDRGLWDGRPSLGGVWVAHPDVKDPERVIIRNTTSGKSIVGALFRRERENPGPLLQVSSDAAEELGMLAGSPMELSVVALRREETEVEEPLAAEENPVVASLAAPVSVEAAPLDPVDPIAGAAAAIDVADAAIDTAVAPAAAVVLPSVLPSADAASDDTADAPIDVSAVLLDLPTADAAGEADLAGPTMQIGVFSVQENAQATAARLRAAGIPASVETQLAGGRDVWRLVASPTATDDGPAVTLTRIQGLGYTDAFLVEDDSTDE